MGINFSRALSLKFSNVVQRYLGMDRCVIAVGRVMTCVLGMVVRREREIREFVKTPFYRVIGTFGPAGISIDGEWRAVEGSRYYGTPCLYKENGFKERKDAEALIAWLWERENGNENSGVMQSEVSDAGKANAGLMGVYNTSQGTILKVEKKKETKNPPLLYNLAELQNDCSKMFKISPDQTLKVVQELYERKLVTYPRTDARVLSTAVAKEISKNIGGLTHYEPLAAFASEAMQAGLWKNIAKTRYVNDKQITDHYAIIPTGQGLGALRSLPELNRKIYQVIVRRFLSIFYPAAVYQKYAVEIEVKGEHFFAGFKVLKEVGYLKVAEIPKKKKDTAGEGVGRTNRLETGIDGNDAENPAREADGTDSSQPKVIDASHPEFIQMLEQLKKGMKVSLDDLQIKEGETSPPKRYSSGSMILAMENAGQLIEDEELRAQIKGSGIGTSATRAEILKKLFNIKYMALNEKTQVITPTYLGELIYEVVHTSMKQLLNPELTASWEKGLTYVAEGSITPDEYMQKLERFVIGRTYNAVHMGNTYGLRPAFDAVAVFYQNAEKVSRSRSVKSRGTAKTARTVKAETSSETTSITSGQEQSK